MKIDAWTVTIDSDDSEALSDFYAKLLGWKKIRANDEFLIVVDEEHGGPWLTFQQIEDYQRPTWPAEPGAQQVMTHLDFHVEDIPAMVQHALDCGATVAAGQTTDAWTVMLDPAGHPFCVCSSHFE